MQVDIAESKLKGIGVEHSHGSFPASKPKLKPWKSPVLTSTRLSAAELDEATSSTGNMLALGRRLKAAGRI